MSAIMPVVAEPALETTMSTPPKRAQTASNAAATEAGSVTSQATARMRFPARTPETSRSSTATSAPSAAKAAAVAAPMAPAPPVTTTTWRSRRFSAALPSLACSRDQYSISKVWASSTGSKRPMDSAFSRVAAQDWATSAVTAASALVLPKPTKPRPGITATRGRGSSCFLAPPAARLLRSK